MSMSEDIIEGVFCQYCGTYIGEEVDTLVLANLAKMIMKMNKKKES